MRGLTPEEYEALKQMAGTMRESVPAEQMNTVEDLIIVGRSEMGVI